MNPELMSLAVSTAWNARYSSSPRPWVGCVISNKGKVFTGFTQGRTGPHAEADALSKALSKAGSIQGEAEMAEMAEMYVTLEPCAHQGKTPPCTQAIISAGIKKVFVGIQDPDPKVSGRGIKELEAAGIQVHMGLLKDEITKQLQPYIYHRKNQRPYVVLKLAASLDGKIAAADGNSRWITGSQARADAHRLRAESDLVLVGAKTIQADDPMLTIRDFKASPLETKVEPPLRAVLGSAPKSAKAQPLLELSTNPKEALQELYEKGIMQVMVEGGGKTAASFHSLGLVDLYVFYYAPRLLCQDLAIQMFHPDLSPEGKSLQLQSAEVLGDDLRLEFLPGEK